MSFDHDPRSPDDGLGELRNAMWSVYLHTGFRNGLKAPILRQDRGLEPMPLDHALEALLRGFDEHDAARRGIALRRLVAAGLHDVERLRQLVGPAAAANLRGLMEQLADSISIDLRLLDGLPLPLALQQLVDMLQSGLWFAGSCKIADPRCVACHDGLSLRTTVTGSVRVNRTPLQLARIVDPRAWDLCNPWFLETFRTKSDKDFSKHADNDTIPLGVPWTGHLFERVQAGPVILHNVLEIKQFQVAPELVRLEYDEHKSIETVFPTGSIYGGIEVDYGFTRVTPVSSGWSRILFRKTLRFVDLTPGPGTEIDYGELLNYWAPAILCLWVDEGTEVGPCCTP